MRVMRVFCQPLLPDHDDEGAVTEDDDTRERGRMESGVSHIIVYPGSKALGKECVDKPSG